MKSDERKEQEELRRYIGPAHANGIAVPSAYKFTLEEIRDSFPLFYQFVAEVRLHGIKSHAKLLEHARQFAARHGT